MRIYLDYNAGAPIITEARLAIINALEYCANPSSVHREGRRAKAIIEQARNEILKFSGKPDQRLIFGASGSEALNLAISGGYAGGLFRDIIVSSVEHPAVIEAVKGSDAPFTILPVDGDGIADVQALERLLGNRTTVEDNGLEKTLTPSTKTLVALQAVNGETGVIQPLDQVWPLVRRYGGLLLVDACQFAGKRELHSIDADFIVISSHKIGGGQGAGGLIANPLVGDNLTPLIRGGGQELNLRAGTENVAAIAGFAAAAKQAHERLSSHDEMKRLGRLRRYLEQEIAKIAPSALFFGARSERVENVSYFAIPGINSETAIIAFDLAGIAVSAGSACSSGKAAPSSVLSGMGFDDQTGRSGIRVSFGHDTTKAQLERFLQVLAKFINA